MIHYTLLPEKEIRTLKREYRTRLLIILVFFVSFAVLIGVAALIPAYVYSSLKEGEVDAKLAEIQSGRKDTGIDDILKELTEISKIAEKIEQNQNKVIPSDIVGRIISQKSKGIQINSFQFSTSVETVKKVATTTVQVVIQGKAENRESLVNFKENLEMNPIFSAIELPVSDLTKSKDIPFSMRLSIVTPK